VSSAASRQRVRLPAVTTLRDHLATESLGGGHPLMVVVPRDALEAVLAENDELREYQEQEEALRSVG
jgi:hypothetical protein